MHNAVCWSKHTKTVTPVEVQDPRFNLICYTQPSNAAKFATKDNTDDGFFQRFMLTLPQEVFVYATDVKAAAQQTNNGDSLIAMPAIIKWIYEKCRNEQVHLSLNHDALPYYETIYDENVRYVCKKSVLSVVYSASCPSKTTPRPYILPQKRLS